MTWWVISWWSLFHTYIIWRCLSHTWDGSGPALGMGPPFSPHPMSSWASWTVFPLLPIRQAWVKVSGSQGVMHTCHIIILFHTSPTPPLSILFLSLSVSPPPKSTHGLKNQINKNSKGTKGIQLKVRLLFTPDLRPCFLCIFPDTF